MPEETRKLLHFTDNVLKSAEKESQELKRRVENRRRAALHAAELSARETAEAYYEREAALIRAEAGREVSRHLMEAKRQLHLRRTEISREVFDKVKQRLADFTAQEDYPDYLKGLLAQVLDRLDGVEEITLRLRAQDLHLGPMLVESAAPVNVRYEEGRFDLGGLAVRCPQLGVRVDCSFDAQLEELSGHFAETFGLSLSDDPAEA